MAGRISKIKKSGVAKAKSNGKSKLGRLKRAVAKKKSRKSTDKKYNRLSTVDKSSSLVKERKVSPKKIKNILEKQEPIISAPVMVPSELTEVANPNHNAKNVMDIDKKPEEADTVFPDQDNDNAESKPEM